MCPRHTTVSSKCVNIIELAEDNDGQAWTVPIITRYSDVYPDNTDILQLAKLTLCFAYVKTFFVQDKGKAGVKTKVHFAVVHCA